MSGELATNAPVTAPAATEEGHDVWLGELLRTSCRPLTTDELTALDQKRRSSGIAFFILMNVLAILSVAMALCDEPSPLVPALFSMLVAIAWIIVARGFSRALSGPVQVFDEPSHSRDRGAQRVLTENSMFELKRIGSDSVSVEHMWGTRPKTLAKRPRNDLRLTQEELSELQKLRKGLGALPWHYLIWLVLCIIRFPDGLNYGGKHLLYRIVISTVLTLALCYRLSAHWSTNRKLNRVIRSGTLRTNDRKDALLLEDGVVWHQYDRPAEWRRAGSSYP